VVFLDEGLLHELLQRHPLKEPFQQCQQFFLCRFHQPSLML
jgi:hypothetical protein